MRLLLPCYDLKLVAPYLEAAALCPSTVILNPWSGPGKALDREWKSAIGKFLKTPFCSLLGYVDSVQWPDDGPNGGAVKKARPKTVTEMQDEIGVWIKVYGISRIFADDVTTRPKIVGLSAVNPGSAPSWKPEIGQIVVTHETNGYSFGMPCVTVDKASQAVMALGEPDYRKPLGVAQARKIGLFFATNAPDSSHCYDQPPVYLKEMAKEAKKI